MYVVAPCAFSCKNVCERVVGRTVGEQVCNAPIQRSSTNASPPASSICIRLARLPRLRRPHCRREDHRAGTAPRPLSISDQQVTEHDLRRKIAICELFALRTPARAILLHTRHLPPPRHRQHATGKGSIPTQPARKPRGQGGGGWNPLFPREGERWRKREIGKSGSLSFFSTFNTCGNGQQRGKAATLCAPTNRRGQQEFRLEVAPDRHVPCRPGVGVPRGWRGQHGRRPKRARGNFE